MARSDHAAGLNVTVSKKALEYLETLIERGSNLGKTPTGIATFIVTREIDRMIDAERNPAYWRQGIGEP